MLTSFRVRLLSAYIRLRCSTPIQNKSDPNTIGPLFPFEVIDVDLHYARGTIPQMFTTQRISLLQSFP